VSDPGYRLVSAAAAAGLRVFPCGGHGGGGRLCASGLATDAFVFEGFLPKKAGPRRQQITSLAGEARTVILFESPQRIAALITELIPEFGDRRAVLAREMTKLYEEFIRGRLSEVLATSEAAPGSRRMHPADCRQNRCGTLLLGGRPGGPPQGLRARSRGFRNWPGRWRASTACRARRLYGSAEDQSGADDIRRRKRFMP